jgi:hypothetical protein
MVKLLRLTTPTHSHTPARRWSNHNTTPPPSPADLLMQLILYGSLMQLKLDYHQSKLQANWHTYPKPLKIKLYLPGGAGPSSFADISTTPTSPVSSLQA